METEEKQMIDGIDVMIIKQARVWCMEESKVWVSIIYAKRVPLLDFSISAASLSFAAKVSRSRPNVSTIWSVSMFPRKMTPKETG